MTISKNMAYVIYELKNRVGVYRLNPSNGVMVEVQSIPTIEDNDIKGMHSGHFSQILSINC